MGEPEDLATLWTFSGLRCVLTPFHGQWQIRVEDGQNAVRSQLAGTSHDAMAIADQWLRELHGEPARARIVARNDIGPTDPAEAEILIIAHLAQQLLERTVRSGPSGMLAVLNVFLTGTLTALNDDPRLKAVAADALADVGQASRLLGRAVNMLGDVL